MSLVSLYVTTPSKKFTPFSTVPLFEEPSAVGDSSTLTPLVESSAFGTPTVFHKQSHPQAATQIKAPLKDNSTLGSSIGVPLLEPSSSGTLNGVPPEHSYIFCSPSEFRLEEK